MNERPLMRYVDAFPVEANGQNLIYLRDPEGLTEQSLSVPHHVYFLLTLMDGQRSVGDLVEGFARQFGGTQIAEKQVEDLIGQLDEVCLLDNVRSRDLRMQREADFRASPIRPAAHAGQSYPPDEVALRVKIDGFFDPPEGPGKPGVPGASPVKALIAPHIDFARGGPCFAWAYKALAESPPPDLFVVFGTGHSAERLFVLSRKDFETPFGLLKADGEVIDRIVAHTSQDLFEDEFAHREEHSIEFQTVFLKYLYPDREIPFVPVLCGSFHEMVQGKHSPMSSSVVSEFVDGLKQALSDSGKRVCFIAGVDFSHVGGRFGDTEALTDDFVQGVERSDRELLDASEAVDAEGFFDVVIRECDRTRVCGTSSIYTMLQVMDAERGELLKYDQAVDLESQSMVSFASMVFY
ncbi:MAG: AmmeMemoRadiSam system protein B [bacterium]|nr:AmmeMemoRadiSam system protein B [bacterium]